MDKKPSLYIDFDETITDSIKAVLSILNPRYGANFKAKDIYKWDFSDAFPNIQEGEVEACFDMNEFWENLRAKPLALAVISRLSNIYDITIVSKCSSINAIKKAKWIDDNLKGVDIKFHPLSLNQSKGDIDMHGGILIDDHQDYLRESNASIKILFKNYPNREWNNFWNKRVVRYWKDIYDGLRNPLNPFNE